MPKKAGMEAWKKKRRKEYLEKKEFRYYIFCEGQQTEPLYFEGFKRHIEENPIYKYSLDGLVEDVEDGLKNTNDIGLVVAWETGELYKRNYHIESLLLEENIGLRSYHGVTHRMRDISTNEYISELILLKDLILYLNNYDECMILQEKYDE